MLAWSGQEPQSSMPVGIPASASNNNRRLDTRHNKHWPGCNDTMSHVFSKGHDANSDVKICEVLCGAFCGPKLFLQITTQKITYKTSFLPSSMQTVETSTTMQVKEHGYLQVHLETYFLHYAVCSLQHF